MTLRRWGIVVLILPGFLFVPGQAGAVTDAEVAAQTTRLLIERVAAHAVERPGTPGAISAWAGARPGEPVSVWTMEGKAPFGVLVPVVGRSGEVRGFAGLESSGQRWRWYAEVDEADRVWLNERKARDVVGARTGRSPVSVEDEFRLIQMPDRRYYWVLDWQDAEGWAHQTYLDARDPSRVFQDAEREAAGLTTAVLNPLPQGRADDLRPQDTFGLETGDGLQRGRYPDEYDIVDVPHYYQNTGYNCGPAALQMVFDYWGEFINQGMIKRAANCTTPHGTYLDDLRRAGHFSVISAAVQNPEEHGYAQRPYGYATMECRWSEGAHYDTRYSDLKELVSSDVPILILTWYGASHTSGHYRVVKGYSGPLDVFIVHDPSTTMGPDINFGQAYLVDDLWEYSSRWGMTSQPWEFVITAPESVELDAEFTVSAEVTYPGAHPFEGQYPSTNPLATLRLPAGLSFAVGEDSSQSIAGLTTSATSGNVSWQVVASGDPGTAVFSVHATGRVSGYSGSYGSYEDDIGGVGQDSVVIESDPASIGDPEAGQLATAILRSCGPNPCVGKATIRFALPERERVRVSVHDAAGRLLVSLLDGQVGAGEHAIPWRIPTGPVMGGSRISSGVYYVRLETESGVRAADRFVVLR